MSKKLLYALLTVIFIESFLLLSSAGAWKVAVDESKANASTTTAVLTTFKEYEKANKELYEENQFLIEQGKKYVAANENLTKELKRVCPTCNVTRE
jgi:hypothetical protein